MRKLLNKKGFSLVELVVAIAIMGIVLCFAVPSYRENQKKTENESCAKNIEIIKLAVVDYYTSMQTAPDSVEDLAPFLDERVLPVCSKSTNSITYNYGVATKKNADNAWVAIVVCGCDDSEHTPEGESDASIFPSSSNPGQCYVLQTASKVEK